jgi:hypothetical protein
VLWESGHITNSENPDYAAKMGKAMKELMASLRSMIFMHSIFQK